MQSLPLIVPLREPAATPSAGGLGRARSLHALKRAVDDRGAALRGPARQWQAAILDAEAARPQLRIVGRD